MKLDIYQVDAFTSKPFGGNPAAVVPLVEWLPAATMQSIAAENNLAETAFFIKNGDGFEIRWFTPRTEINLCGHATLGSAHVLFEELGYDGTTIKFFSRHSGELGVSKKGDLLVLDFPAYPVSEIAIPDDFASAPVKPIKAFETQGHMLMMVLANQQAVNDLDFVPDPRMIQQMPYDEIIVTAKGDDCDFASRMFAPKLGIPEDPVTGAIHCSLIPYWANELGKTTLFARQLSERGGELFCELAESRVKIGGNAVLYLKGEIYVAAEKGIAA